MSFNEKAARKIIMFLLENDVYDFKRWVPLIKKFNSEQIQKLFQGERDYNYTAKNKAVFDNLVLKFDNFATILSKWYEKEENYQYIKQLWLNYICIEDINEEIEKNLSEEKLTSFLESKNINYSKWPEEVKKEFKEAVQEAIGTYIHEEEIKKKLNEEHSGLKKCLDSVNNLMKSFTNIFADTDKEAQKIFEQNYSSIKLGIVGGLFSFIGSNIFSYAKEAINSKALKRFLIDQIQGYDICKFDAKKIANDIMKKNWCPNDWINWRVGNGCDWFEFDEMDGTTCHNCINQDIQIDLSEMNSDTLSIGKKISAVFKSKVVCGLTALASFINLGFSAYEFYTISNLTETIAGKEYQKNFDEIKQQFKDHLNELDLTDNCYGIKAKLIYVKNNIENDKEKLVNLIKEIKADIKLLKRHKKDSIISLAFSALLGGGSILGGILTSGGTSLIYSLSTVFNLISGGININNISICNRSIEELEAIKKQAEEEEKIMQEEIKKLDLKLKQKEFDFPTHYEDCDNIFQKKKKKMDNYMMNRLKL